MLKRIIISLLLLMFLGTLGSFASQPPAAPIIVSETEMVSLVQKAKETVQKSSKNDPTVMKIFTETLQEWQSYYGEKKDTASLQILLEAVIFSAEKTGKQPLDKRDPNAPILHALQTQQILWKEGNIRDVNPQMLALLQQTLENSHATPEEVDDLFGPTLGRLLEEYEETAMGDKNLEEKQQIISSISSASLEVRQVKLADRIDYLRSNQAISSPVWKNTQLQNFTWDMQLLHALKGTNPLLETILEDTLVTCLG